MPLDTLNKFIVGAYGRSDQRSTIVLRNPPRAGQPISREDALLLAAYLVVLSGGEEAFAPVLAAVQGT